MNHITIKPLLKLLEAAAKRSHLTLGDLAQAADKVTNQLKAKSANPAQKHSVYIEEAYLKIIGQLRKNFAGHKAIAFAELLDETDRVLRENNFYNYAREAPPATPLRVFYDPEAAPAADYTSYDLAFYNTQTVSVDDINPYEGTHHIDGRPGKPSLYFARCEKFNDTMVIGNLQIDKSPVEDWTDPELRKLMTRRANVQADLVRQTIVHALAQGCKKIIFQAGDAVEYAQWRDHYAHEVRITKDNFADYMRRYEKAVSDFTACEVGDFAMHNNRNDAVVSAKTATEYNFIYVNNSRINCNMSYTIAALDHLCFMLDCPIKESMARAHEHLRQRHPEQLLEEIDGLFTAANIPPPAPSARVEKLAALRKLCATQNTYSLENIYENFAKNINPFLTKFNYPQAILTRYPQWRQVVNRQPTATGNPFYLIDSTMEYVHDVFKKATLIKPELGMTYKVHKYLEHDFLCRDSGYYMKGLDKITGWYEHDLPKILNKFKLGIRRVPLANGKVRAHGWEIISGVEQFVQTPHAIFASHAALKLDAETLPRLHTAARKFGLTPAQLVVIHDVVATATGSGAGCYEPGADKVILSNNSLAVLAHECLHRLVAQRQVPPAVYKNLVAAGQKLVTGDPNLRAYIEQKDAAGHWIYPPGPARANECAALFVENYYEHEAAARKRLTGQKLTLLERVLGYVREVCDIMRGGLGDQAAQARGFLRRVEDNRLFAAQQRIGPAPRGGNRQLLEFPRRDTQSLVRG